MDKKQIVVLGGGFAGLTFCRHFRHEDAEVTLVDQTNHHLFQPLLYQVATCGLSAPQIAEPLRGIFRGRRGVRTVMDTIESVDFANKVVIGHHLAYPYDYLVLGLGGRTSYFGNDHWAEHAPGLKTLQDALQIRTQILSAFEEAEVTTDPGIREKLMTIVVVGGGPTGLELAGACAELTKQVFQRNFRTIKPEESRIILIEGGNRLLPSFAEDLSASALKQVQSLGVEVRLGQMVSDIRHHEIDVGHETLEAANILWAAGIEAAPLVRTFPVEHDRSGRISVEPDLSLPGFPEVFACGDMVRMTDINGKPVPGVSPAAMQMAGHVAKLIRKELTSGPIPQHQRRGFAYLDKGSMATIGRSRAVAQIGLLKLKGYPAWLGWLLVHLIFLVGFRNKMKTLLDWFYSYINFRHGARVIASAPHPQKARPKPAVEVGSPT